MAESGRIRLLWSADFHDAPISGLAEVGGKEVWFDTPFDEEVEEYAVPRDRECVLYELTDAELQDLRGMHERFEQWVSTQGCYHLTDAERFVRDQSTWHLFYDADVPELPDVGERQSVGSFRLVDAWESRGDGTHDHAR
jgi:hypothetical protein